MTRSKASFGRLAARLGGVGDDAHVAAVHGEHVAVVNVSSSPGSLVLLGDPDQPQAAFPGVAYPTSKTALDVLTVRYANAFPGMRINAVCPGFTSTDVNDHRGTQTVEEGAEIIVRMACVGPDGPTGTLSDVSGTIPW